MRLNWPVVADMPAPSFENSDFIGGENELLHTSLHELPDCEDLILRY
jgi:hypothetical protein